MNQFSFQPTPPAPPPPWFPLLPPDPPQSIVFWESKNVHNQIKQLQETLKLAEAMYVCANLLHCLLVFK